MLGGNLMSYNIINRNPAGFNSGFAQPQKVNATQNGQCDLKTLKLLREALASEIYGINQYEEIITQISDPRIVAMLTEIRNNEIIHSGQLLAAIETVCPRESELREAGRQEFFNQPTMARK